MMKLVKLSELFEIKYGNSFALEDMKLGGINFIARGSDNNGVSDFVQKVDNIQPFEPFQITVAVSGSVMESFLQTKPFYTGYHVKVLTPKIKLTEDEMLFYCTCLRANKYRYSYGRQANKTLSDILIPDKNSIPSFVYKAKITKPSNVSIVKTKLQLQTKNWKVFKISELFDKIEKAKCNNASDLLTNGDDIFYIGAKKNNNGVMAKVDTVDGMISKGSAICFIGDGQGSIGYTTYQPFDFIGTTTLTVAYSKHLNKYNAMFLVTILDQERYRYSFGRKYSKTVIENNNTQIKLPQTAQGEPDWEFMENYIKSLSYSGSL